VRYIDFADVAAATGPTVYIFAGLCAAVVIIFVGLMLREGEFLPVPAIVAAAALACGIVALTVEGPGPSLNQMAARDGKIQEQIEDRYGLKLTDREVERLNYPSAEPEKDFEVYGSAIRNVRTDGDGFERQEVSLIWNGERFELAQSEDGKSFVPLKPLNREEPSEKPAELSDEPLYETAPQG
jgi:hypothetical protein